MTVILRTYNAKIFVKYIERGGTVASYIIYAVVRNFLEWKICICSYCDYCDCHVASVEDWRLFFESLRQEYPQYRIAVRNLRDALVREVPELRVLSREKFHYLDLHRDLPSVWRETHDSFKAAVKQAAGSRFDAPEVGITGVHDLHLRIRKINIRFPQPFLTSSGGNTGTEGVLLGAYGGR